MKMLLAVVYFASHCVHGFDFGFCALMIVLSTLLSSANKQKWHDNANLSLNRMLFYFFYPLCVLFVFSRHTNFQLFSTIVNCFPTTRISAHKKQFTKKRRIFVAFFPNQIINFNLKSFQTFQISRT